MDGDWRIWMIGGDGVRDGGREAIVMLSLLLVV
jgi:hypothetical protein